MYNNIVCIMKKCTHLNCAAHGSVSNVRIFRCHSIFLIPVHQSSFNIYCNVKGSLDAMTSLICEDMLTIKPHCIK